MLTVNVLNTDIHYLPATFMRPKPAKRLNMLKIKLKMYFRPYMSWALVEKVKPSVILFKVFRYM